MSLINEDDSFDFAWKITALFLFIVIGIFSVTKFNKLENKNNIVYDGSISCSSIKSYCDYGNNNLLYIAPNGSIAVVPGGCNGK